MSRTQSIALAVVAIVAVAAGILLARQLIDRSSGAQPATVAATVLTPPRPLPALELIDHEGKPLTIERLRGRWTFLFFGFTNCPDVCPTTMAMLAQTVKLLSDVPAERQPQVLLISVDPQRDTPERLAAYVKSFHPAFIGGTAEQPVIDALTKQMGVFAAIHRGEGGTYSVDHSGAVFLIDENGALRALFSPPHTPEHIADDYRRIAR